MGVLDRFEKGIERAVNGAFAKAFRSEVQPVEIASALRREVDDKAAIVGRDRTIVPNTFVVELGHADHDRLGQWTDALGDELGAVINDHARQQRYSFVGPVSVAFEEAEDLDTGVFRVRSQTIRRDGQAHPSPGSAARGSAAPDPAAGAAPGAAAGADAAAAAAAAAAGAAAARAARAAGSAAAGSAAAAPAGAGAVAPSDGLFGAAAPRDRSAAGGAQAAGHNAADGDPNADDGDSTLPAGGAGAGVRAGVRATAPAPVAPGLVVDGRPYEITSAVTVIGRGMDADIVLDDPGASRRHAEVHILDGKARVIDLGSTNGTFVDGDRSPVGTLRDGSTITIGRTRITFSAGDLATWQPEGGRPDWSQGDQGRADEHRGPRGHDQRGRGQW